MVNFMLCQLFSPASLVLLKCIKLRVSNLYNHNLLPIIGRSGSIYKQ